MAFASSRVQLSLQAAYAIIDDADFRPLDRVFWAIDRLSVDIDTLNEDSQAQRRAQIMLGTKALDRRDVPVRDPAIEKAAVEAIRLEIYGEPDLVPNVTIGE